MNRRILLLMPTTTYRVGDFLAAARAIGVEVAVGSDQKQALEDYNPGATLTLDFTDPARSTQRIAAFADTFPLAAVVSLDDEGTVVAARAAEALGLRGNLPAAARIAGNKHLMRQTCEAAGLPTPRFTLLPVDGDPAAAARRLPYPCVLKPLSLSGSRGVIRADDETQFVEAFRRVAAILATPSARRRGPASARSILAESFVPGAEVAVEGLLVGGAFQVLAIFDKPDPLEGPHFEETIYVTPSRRAPAAVDAIVATTRRAIAAIGLVEGPVHAELRWDGTRAWPIDIAARSIGGLCSRSLSFGDSIRLEEVILRAALGERPERLERERRASGVMMIPIPAAGILREVRGEAEARAVAGVTGLELTLHPGTELVPLPEGHRYLGFLFADAETPAAVEASLREAHRRLEFVVD